MSKIFNISFALAVLVFLPSLMATPIKTQLQTMEFLSPGIVIITGVVTVLILFFVTRYTVNALKSKNK